MYYISEHRGSYANKSEISNIYFEKPDLVIFAISITRFEAKKASQILKKDGIQVSLVNILWLKPTKISNKSIENLKNSKHGGLVLDDDYVNGVAKSIANDLNLKTNKNVNVLGLKDRTAGTGKNLDNMPPNAIEIEK